MRGGIPSALEENSVKEQGQKGVKKSFGVSTRLRVHCDNAHNITNPLLCRRLFILLTFARRVSFVAALIGVMMDFWSRRWWGSLPVCKAF